MTKIEFVVEALLLLMSGGFTTYLFQKQKKKFETKLHDVLTEIHQHVESVESHLTQTVVDVKEAGAAAKAEITAHVGVCTQEVKQYLEAHNEDLKQNAYALKVHAQQMHDEAQARHAARVVPTRGK